MTRPSSDWQATLAVGMRQSGGKREKGIGRDGFGGSVMKPPK